MNDQYTDITFIQDKSGSMSSLRDETIGGYNTFIQDQRKVPGKCTVSLTQFDTNFNSLYEGKPLAEVPSLSHATYKPGGNTALLDAIGRTIVLAGQRLAAMPEPERPGRVVVVITTDGYENSSQRYKKAEIAAMIKEQEEKWKWNFIFLGANMDAIAEGEGIGMKSANIMSAGVTGQAVGSIYSALADNVRGYRISTSNDPDKLAFKKKQREDQVKEGAAKDKLNQ